MIKEGSYVIKDHRNAIERLQASKNKQENKQAEVLCKVGGGNGGEKALMATYYFSAQIG